MVCSLSSKQTEKQCPFWIMLNSLHTNLAAMHRMLSSSNKIHWPVPHDSLTMSHTSWIVLHFPSWFLLKVVQNARHRQLIFILLWNAQTFPRPRTLSPNDSLSILCLHCCLIQFEIEFDAYSLFLHISYFNKSIQSQNSTNNVKTSHIKMNMCTQLDTTS
jgi:hypothetical protein